MDDYTPDDLEGLEQAIKIAHRQGLHGGGAEGTRKLLAHDAEVTRLVQLNLFRGKVWQALNEARTSLIPQRDDLDRIYYITATVQLLAVAINALSEEFMDDEIVQGLRATAALYERLDGELAAHAEEAFTKLSQNDDPLERIGGSKGDCEVDDRGTLGRSRERHRGLREGKAGRE